LLPGGAFGYLARMWTSFIGFMASGKTSVTRRLQSVTSRPQASVDALIVQTTGLPISRLFDERGEPAFRQLELETLASLEAARPLLVDTGGGVVNTPAAVDLLRERGVVIWLDEPWITIRSRLDRSDPEERPLVRDLGWSGLEALFRRRRALYAAAADFRLCGQDGDLEALAHRAMLRSLIWERRQDGKRS